MSDEHARVLFTQAQSLKKQGEVEQATALLEKARALAPDSLGILAELGILYGQLGRNDEAIECLDSYVSQKADESPILIVLGMLLISQGHVERGVERLEQAGNREPLPVSGLLALSRVRGNAMHETHIEVLTKTLEQEDLSVGDRCSICFALAVAHDKPGREDSAFKYWTEANALRLETIPKKADPLLSIMPVMSQVFSHDAVAKLNSANNSDPLPVFVVGMPRSGTSLVEQILASHSKVHGAGELRDLASTVALKISGATGSTFVKAIAECSSSDFDLAADHYVQALRAHSPDSSRIVDKMPHNFVLIGVIQLMLPGAKIIHLRRDPMDTCWSIFKTPLKSVHPFACHLESIAKHYLEYRSLMDHWRAVFPGKIHDVQYEELVSHPKREIEKLLAVCGLEFEEACLEFHQTSRPVGTASEFQVRKPMYTSSIGAWKPYAKHLSLWTEMFKGLD